jgi:hypothetical protein
MDSILQWLDKENVDTLLGQEANVSCQHVIIQLYVWGQQCSHIQTTSSETEWIYNYPYKPGGTFCISTLEYTICRADGQVQSICLKEVLSWFHL